MSHRYLPVLSDSGSGRGVFAVGRRWLMLALAVAHAVLALLLFRSGLPGSESWGLAARVAPSGWACFIVAPVALGYLGLGLIGLHPRYRGDMLLRRIRWLSMLGLAVVCARQMGALIGMDWLSVPLDLAGLVLLGRATMVLGWWQRPISMARRMVVNLPIGLHAGALTVLVPLDILSALPLELDAPPPSDTGGFLALVAVLALAVAGVRLFRAEPAYVCGVVWMLVAIALRGGVATVAQPLTLMALLAALVVVILAVWTRRQRGSSYLG